MPSRSLVPILNLLTLLTLLALFNGPEPNAATTGDTGSGLDPNGRP